MLSSILPLEPKRLLTYFVLAVISAAGCYLTFLLKPEWKWVQILTVGLGYAALLFTVVTLVIGPVNLLWQRRNPANINLRRDTGIGAGITGSLHVLFGFQVHMGGRILEYFFDPAQGYRPMLNLFGASNYIGAAATVILALLLLLSNNLSLRLLKGRLWKLLQQFNYLLIILTVVHTLGYQVLIKRAPIMIFITLGLSLLVLAAQAVGFLIYQWRQSTASLIRADR